MPNAEVRSLLCFKLVEFWGRDSITLGTDYFAAMCSGHSTIPSCSAQLQTDHFYRAIGTATITYLLKFHNKIYQEHGYLILFNDPVKKLSLS